MFRMKGGGGVHTRAASQGLVSGHPILQRTSGRDTSLPGPAGLPGLGGGQSLAGLIHSIKSSSCQWYPFVRYNPIQTVRKTLRALCGLAPLMDQLLISGTRARACALRPSPAPPACLHGLFYRLQNSPLPFLKTLQFQVTFIQEDFDRVLSCPCLQVKNDTPKMWIRLSASSSD